MEKFIKSIVVEKDDISFFLEDGTKICFDRKALEFSFDRDDVEIVYDDEYFRSELFMLDVCGEPRGFCLEFSSSDNMRINYFNEEFDKVFSLSIYGESPSDLSIYSDCSGWRIKHNDQETLHNFSLGKVHVINDCPIDFTKPKGGLNVPCDI
jgi:hypothetical protein